MNKNGAKLEKIHHDYLVDNHQRNMNLDSEEEIRAKGEGLNFRFDNEESGLNVVDSLPVLQSSLIEQSSPRASEKVNKKNGESSAENGFLKKPSGLLQKGNWNEKNSTSSKNKEHAELNEIPTRTEGKKDARKFKSMTIDRMGKMLKLRSSNFESNQSELTSKEKGELRTSDPSEQPSIKDKTKSLGRMLKLMDKDSGPRRIFGFSRSESPVRIQEVQSSIEKKETPLKVSDDRIRRAFSKMLFQIKGRGGSGNSSAEPNFRSCEGKSKVSLPPGPPIASRLIANLSNSRASISSTKRTPLSTEPESSTSENLGDPL